MKLPFPRWTRAGRWACAVLLISAGAVAQAQSSTGRVRAVPPVAPPPAPATGAPAPGLPSPAGLNPRFPAGLTAETLVPPGTGGGTGGTGGTGGGGRPIGGGVGNGNGNGGADGSGTVATNVMGAGAPQPAGIGPGPYTAVDVARSFLFADANRDGELSRAEARRLTLGAFAFEELDADHDGIITRGEYDDAMLR